MGPRIIGVDAVGAPGRVYHFLGIFCVAGAMVSFSTNDMGVKWLSGDYPLHQIVLIRSIVALLFTLAVFIPLEGGLKNIRTRRLGLHLLRGFGIVIANLAFFTSVATLSLAEATTIFFISPLLITMFSALLLGETVGIRRWSAVIMGLAGVLLILRPGTGMFQFVGILPMVAALAYALVQISTRVMGATEKASTMAFYIQLTLIVVSATVGLAIGDGRYGNSTDPTIEFLLRAWVVPPVQDALIMAGIGGLSALGGYLISQGYRLSAPALLAPFEYVAVPVAVLWSIFFFQDTPDTLAWLGIFLVVAAGLYTVYREMVRGRRELFSDPVPRNR